MAKISEAIHIENLIARHMRLWEAQQHHRRQLLKPSTGRQPEAVHGVYISFAREYGSGGLEISQRVAEKLGWQHFHRDLADPLAYDLILNVEHLDMDAAAEIVIRTAESKLKTTLLPSS
jgi:hypothetical protein